MGLSGLKKEEIIKRERERERMNERRGQAREAEKEFENKETEEKNGRDRRRGVTGRDKK